MRKCTDTHEWVEVIDDQATVGISIQAAKELGEIVYVELPQVGKSVERNQEVCCLESTKAAIDLYSPVSGKIVAVNIALQSEISALNQSPEKEGWLYRIALTDMQELDLLHPLPR